MAVVLRILIGGYSLWPLPTKPASFNIEFVQLFLYVIINRMRAFNTLTSAERQISAARYIQFSIIGSHSSSIYHTFYRFEDLPNACSLR